MTKTGCPDPGGIHSDSDAHKSDIISQFTRQAKLFAGAKSLHSDQVINLLVEAANPEPNHEMLDVACGPGTIVAAFAPRVRRAVGFDVTGSMLEEAAKLGEERGLKNVEWRLGDALGLPFPDQSFDIVTCRFAFHHMLQPAKVLGEMKRVCRKGGTIVVCDGVASDDPIKALAFNQMERFRDSSTTRFLTSDELLATFEEAGLKVPQLTRFRVPSERDTLARGSFPVNDDRAALCRMIDESVEGDTMGLGAHDFEGTVRFYYPSVILVAARD